MADATIMDDSAASTSGLGDKDHTASADSISEWRRSCQHGDNGIPSTSPPFWDTDSDDDDPGPRPSDLFGRYTWKIENFSKEKKREMKSEPFEAGGYKWYILVYPQGCDVSNHLSLFLCVADHEKLLPGWSHFAQFTIAVGNLDPKKVKYSDTLHKFWKKEHDWGWKKFMELSKIQDGFLVDDVLEIIAQVQVIREKADRPFRCLDRPYRRELLRVYMTNIEQIYRRFVHERRRKLVRLIDDDMKWSSFRAFWLAIDPTTKHRMSREKSDTILKIAVKHFFVEKDVTSTLVMDALYTGLKALEGCSNGKKGTDLEKLSAPMVHVDMDMFVLAGDFITLLERAALEPLSCQSLSSKDDKCSQTRAKDGGTGEINKVSIEQEERRLTELGRKIIEIFVLSHIFSGVDVAYQEAVALKRQEELIREEELLENEMKGKRGSATEKDKRSKKKQAKQKKNNRKVKDKEREEKSDSNFLERHQDGSTNYDREDSNKVGQSDVKADNLGEGASDLADNLSGSTETCKDEDSVDIETLVTSVSAAVNSIRGKINNLLDSTSLITPNRGRSRRNRGISSIIISQYEDDLPSSSCSDRNISVCGPAPRRDQETALLTLKDRLRELGQRLHEKEIEGRELLKAHLEKKAAAEATGGSSSASSSNSLEKTPQVLKGPEKSSVIVNDANDANVNAPLAKAVPVAISDDSNGVVPATATATSTTNTKSVPVSPTPSKLEEVLCEEHVSGSSQQTNKAPLTPSRSPLVDNKANPTPPKSPVPQADTVVKATPAPPKSPLPPIDTVAKATAAPTKPSTSQLDKVANIQAAPKSPAPQVDEVASHNSVSRQILSTSVSKTREDTVSERASVVSVTGTPTRMSRDSRPTSAPLLQVPRSTMPSAPSVQVSPLLSRSLTVSERPNNEPSSQAPIYAQTYRNAILGKGHLDTMPASVEQSTSVCPNTAVSQPWSAYAMATSVMAPFERNDQLPGKQGFMFGPSRAEALDNRHSWKGNSDVNRNAWKDDVPNQQMTNGDAHLHRLKDISYQQLSSSGTEQRRLGGLQCRELQREIPAASVVSRQQYGSVGEEFPHIDIINDLLDEDQSSAHMAVPPLHEYHTFGLPFSSGGNMAESEIASGGSSVRFDLTNPYYDEGYRRAYDTQNALHRLDAYPNGRLDSTAPQRWPYSHPNPAVSLANNSNVFPQQMGEYTNLASGRLNGEYSDYMYRHANGQW